jgi:hypothetical protein
MNPVVRFRSHVAQGDPDQCWEWRKSKDKDGYGKTFFAGTFQQAHRVAFYVENGHWPKFCCHHCDNPACCNPAHLYDGDGKTNAQDRLRRGRQDDRRGDRNPNSHASKSARQHVTRKVNPKS